MSQATQITRARTTS